VSDDGRELVQQIAQQVRREDYRFTVTVREVPYDVYGFYFSGRHGTLAFRITPAPEKQVIIAVCAAGTLTPDEVAEKIRLGQE
jgi:hypothetical protein